MNTPTEKSLYLETLGCQMNALDSELAFGALVAEGFRLTDDLDGASLVVINTCSVRQHAEDKVYSRLGQLKHTRQQNPDRVVAVIGCMAERDGDGLLEKVPHVDILCGPSELHRLPALVREVVETRRRAIALSGRLRSSSTPVREAAGHEDLESLDSGRQFSIGDHAATPRGLGRRQAYVRIARGCNKHCTFCVVPYTRGPERHRPPGQIIDEVGRLADAGVMEVTLLGQTINHYRYERQAPGQALGEVPGGATTFAELLRRVHDEVPQLPRLRFVTSFPRDFTDAALEAMAASPRICRYLHLPAQSGSDEQLRRMNRGYNVEQYEALLTRARAFMPDVSIAGDMIVGFSGETEADFRQTCDLLRRARYKNCFVFKYSPRPGTVADDRYPDDVPDEVKRRRNNDLLAIQAEISLENHRALIGRTVEVLVEGPSKSAIRAQQSEQDRGGQIENAPRAGLGSQLVGRTRGDQIVVFDGGADLIGTLTTVEIQAATPYTLHGAVKKVVAQPRGAGESNIPLPLLGV